MKKWDKDKERRYQAPITGEKVTPDQIVEEMARMGKFKGKDNRQYQAEIERRHRERYESED